MAPVPRYTAAMSNFKPKGTNPFKPGAGLPPPLLAGRDRDIAFFKDRLARVKAHGSGDAIAVYGPRGMGKTVLMRQVRDDFQREGVHAVWATPKQGMVAAESIAELLPKGFKMGQLEISAGTGPLTELAGALKATWRSDKGEEARFTSLLQEAGKQAPRALFMDEAHTISKDEMNELLNMMQEVMHSSRFMLVLIGTPGLTQSVRQGGTFGERFRYHSINMLDGEATIEALQVPLGEGGISAPKALLHEVALDAQRYPFFIQVWGEALWGYAAKNGIERLTDGNLRDVLPGVARQRDDFYHGRFEEIRKDKALRVAATAVADAFNSGDKYDHEGIAEIITLALKPRVADEDEREEKAEALLSRLIEVGYVWKPTGIPFIEAGIPSLMAYVAAKRGSRQPQLPAADLRRIGTAAAKRLGPRICAPTNLLRLGLQWG